jgi:hypothetical protein
MTAAPCILGIDPGLSGAVAFYFPEAPDRVIAEDMPVAAGMVDCATLAARIRQMAPGLAIVERVASMPRADENIAQVLPGHIERADSAKLGLECHGERD